MTASYIHTLKQLAYPLLRLGRRLGFALLPLSQEGYSDTHLATKIVEAENLHLKVPVLDDGDCCAGRGWIEARTVLDFGGGGGRHLKSFAKPGMHVAWRVVETPAFCEVASNLLGGGQVLFSTSVNEAADELGTVDLVHVSSSLQYTSEPIEVLKELLGRRAKFVVMEKLVVTSRSHVQTFWQYSSLRANIPVHKNREKSCDEWKFLRYKLTASPLETYMSEFELAEYRVRKQWVDPRQSHLPFFKGLSQLGFVLERV